MLDSIQQQRICIAVVFFLLASVFSYAFPQTPSSDSLDSRAASAVSHKKSPSGAALRSLVIPGWGQYYNGKKIKAGLAFAGEAGLLGMALHWNSRAADAKRANDETRQLQYEDWRNGCYWGLAALIVYSMLDAYVDAQLSDFDESPVLDTMLLAPRAPVFALRVQIRL
ncbi:hypothetical protein FBQ85_05635 [Cytophagia bacterium CHB2]|nr:hypothetical protein [Cytophagia bacterium CHB2]